MAKNSGLTAVERREVVLRLLRKEESAAALGRRFGISEATLYTWRDKFLSAGEAALHPGRGKVNGADKRVKVLERAVEERERVIGELTIANRILQKLSSSRH